MDTLIISPHYDDAVFSCGEFMSQVKTHVLTVCGGVPADPELLTEYDKKCGFTTSQNAMQMRARENHDALEYLEAVEGHFDFMDSQYEQAINTQGLKDMLWAQIKQAGRVLAPLGLLHPDHVLISDLVLELKSRFTGELYLYEELPYRVVDPLQVPPRLAKLEYKILKRPHTDTWHNTLGAKEAAFSYYGSQLSVGDINMHNLLVPERYWKIN